MESEGVALGAIKIKSKYFELHFLFAEMMNKLLSRIINLHWL